MTVAPTTAKHWRSEVIAGRHRTAGEPRWATVRDYAEEFRESAQRCDYALNFMWADKDGDIAYVHLGRYPDSEAVDWDTRLPADGTQYELTSADYLRAADGDVHYAINPNPGSRPWNNVPAAGSNNHGVMVDRPPPGTDHQSA